MSTILEDIETQIANLRTTTTKSNVGIVREVGDGVAKIEGLSDVMLNEMIEFPNGVTGLALNLEENEVGAILARRLRGRHGRLGGQDHRPSPLGPRRQGDVGPRGQRHRSAH